MKELIRIFGLKFEKVSKGFVSYLSLRTLRTVNFNYDFIKIVIFFCWIVVTREKRYLQDSP